jgi:DNA-binding transcriptional LysR family regulator
MVRRIDWENQIGRRLKLRDLHVFVTIARRGSMGKAAAHLGVSQPSISAVMAELEHAVGVPLLERNPHGVEPTAYGHALLKRATVALDELKESIKDIEFLADPTVGEVRIGCAESVSTALLPPVIERFSKEYPGIVVHVNSLVSPTLELPELRARSIDLFISRLVRPLASITDDLNVEILFNDRMVVAAGMKNRWAHRQKIDLADLVDEPWILNPPHSWNYITVAEAFRARGLNMPKICLMSFSIHLRANLLATGPYITGFPGTFVQLNANPLLIKVLPIELPVRPWPVAIVTLKHRTLSPIAQRFIDHIRAFTRSMTGSTIFAKKSASA